MPPRNSCRWTPSFLSSSWRAGRFANGTKAEATELAQGWPVLQNGGTVEVRPIVDVDLFRDYRRAGTSIANVPRLFLRHDVSVFFHLLDRRGRSRWGRCDPGPEPGAPPDGERSQRTPKKAPNS